MKLVPIIKFPLKVMFIDDDEKYFSALDELNLPNKIVTFTNPLEALKVINSTPSLSINLFNDVTESTTLDRLNNNDEAVLSFAINNVFTLLNNKQQREIYGIIITDFDMKEMNGIELCKNIIDENKIKILITGAYDSDSAVEAHNKEIIDNFVPKGKPDTLTKLINSIGYLESKFFESITNEVIRNMDNKLSFLSNTNYIRIFSNVLSDYKITEYCLLNKTGSYSLNTKNNKYTLNVYNAEDLELFCEMYASEVGKDILEKIRERKVIPSFAASGKHEFYPCINDKDYFYNVIEIF